MKADNTVERNRMERRQSHSKHRQYYNKRNDFLH